MKPTITINLLCAVPLVAFTTTIHSARAQCAEWGEAFPLAGLDGPVRALATFDDGSGLALYAGGEFTVAGEASVSNIARWDGVHWTALGDGLTEGGVEALLVFDDGSGPMLVAGGSFTRADGYVVLGLARWNGSNWMGFAGFGTNGNVHALAGFDDGSGPALYVGGDFSHLNGAVVNRVARWNGTTWSSLGAGIGPTTSEVNALLPFDDGSGLALFAGGTFASAGGTSAHGIAKWSGGVWSPLGAGANGVNALISFDDGTGSALYVAGGFPSSSGLSSRRIAKWNGTGWSGLEEGPDASVLALAAFNDGTGPALYAGGSFGYADGHAATRVAKWNGHSWSALGTGVHGITYALATFDDGRGPALYLGGTHRTAGEVATNHLARWDGAAWSATSNGNGVSDSIEVLAVFDDGKGSALYAGGSLGGAGVTRVPDLGRWNGTEWRSLGTDPDGSIFALVALDVGTGPSLYAGGNFDRIGGQLASAIACWSGSQWNALGTGIDGSVRALIAFDDGGGPSIFAAGSFSTAGGSSARGVARWDGSNWFPLGAGLTGTVNALAVYDDGVGSALYVAGNFSVIGIPTGRSIAKWNGTAWAIVGGGIPGTSSTIRALTVFEEGPHSSLIAAGEFTSAGGVNANHVARWNGTSWSAMGTGFSGPNSLERGVHALTTFDEGGGPVLYAGGNFMSAGSVPARYLARWEGSSWASLAGGTDGIVRAFATFEDGVDGAPDLYMGGDFARAGFMNSARLARWLGCPSGEMYCFGDGLDPVVTVSCPCGNDGAFHRGCANSNGGLQGARLTATGTALPNTLLFECTGIPNGNLVTFLRGTSNVSTGVIFGDGIKCLGGSILRFGQQVAGRDGNAPHSVASTTTSGPIGSTRYFQVQYRNSHPGFCPPALFNLSNGYKITWL